MKHLFSILTLFAAIQLSGQTNFQPAQQLIKTFAKTWSNPAQVLKFNERGAGLLITHTLDSIVSKNASSVVTDKLEMEYNSQGYTTSMRQYGRNENPFVLGLESATSFEYQTPGYVSRILIDTFNTQTQQLDRQLEMEIIYDGSNRIDSVVISLDDPLFGSGFIPYLAIKEVYSGDLLVQTRQWINIILLGGWLPAAVIDYQYDANDRLTDQLTSGLDFESGDIVPTDWTTYTYNAQGLTDVVTDYSWNDPAWDPYQRTSYSYYPNETLSAEIIELYSTGAGAWENYLWTSYPVENVTDAFPVTSYEWDPALSTWNALDSTFNLLNPALPWSQVAAPTQLGLLSLLGGGSVGIGFIDDPKGSAIDEVQYFLVDTNSQQFYLDSRDIYYYGLSGSSAVNPVLPAYLSIFPNPALDQFYIDLDLEVIANYTVHNNTGAVVAKGQIGSGKHAVQTAGWVPGIYFVSIQLNDGSIYVQKQIIE